MQNKRKLIWLWLVVFGFISTAADGVPFREYPISDSIEKNRMEIAAVWLPPVKMDNTPDMDDLKKKKKVSQFILKRISMPLREMKTVSEQGNGFPT